MQKILILGGKPIGSCEITMAAKKRGLYTIVADYLPTEQSPAKQIAHESWDISTADVEELRKKCIEENVKAVITGVHEFNIERKIELCEKLGFPQYCTEKQWFLCENKAEFKKMCSEYKIPVAKTYQKDDLINYPVVVKPIDGSGSRGFSVCHNEEELDAGIEEAMEFSASKQYLIEEYIQSEACIIHYTAVNGEIVFSGMSDKHSQMLEGGSSVMALQMFPSKDIKRYLDDVNEKAVAMFKALGVTDGPIWIEAFNDVNNKRFIFNEMGYRFGGSMTNYPVEHFYGINQIDLMLDNALGQKSVDLNVENFVPETSQYCILPIHVKAGKIEEISGFEESKKIKGVEQFVFVHHSGDEIKNWGTAQQVFCYLHIAFDTVEELAETIKMVKSKISVKDVQNNEMLFYMFDLNKLGAQKNLNNDF